MRTKITSNTNTFYAVYTTFQVLRRFYTSGQLLPTETQDQKNLIKLGLMFEFLIKKFDLYLRS